MARMYPERIPAHVREDPYLVGECLVYEALQRSLDDPCAVLFRVPWLQKRRAGRAQDGEADFVVVHPERGILVLEAKGGGISRDAVQGVWTSRNRHGQINEIHDPIEQAKKGKYALLEYLKNLPRWKKRWIEIGHGAVFPDSGRNRSPLGPDTPYDILAFSEDMVDLGPRIEAMLEYWQRSNERKESLRADGVEAIVRSLAPTYRLPMPLAPGLREQDRQIVELTERQFYILDRLSRERQVLVRGGAGTGKTFLAMEQARRLAARGARTLLTCFNRPLADFLRASAEAQENLTVLNFHQLAYQWARRAGLEAINPDGPDAKNMGQRYYEQDLPDLLVEALSKLPERFDAIIVDEGQDLTDTYWACLDILTDDLKHAQIYVFQDDAQSVFETVAPQRPGMQQYVLSFNLRNTQGIHAILRNFIDDGTAPFGPRGEVPELITAVDAQAENKILSRVLHRLIVEDKFLPEEIAILTSARKWLDIFAPDNRIGRFEITRDFSGVAGKVLLETIHRFKGLERRVIILAGLRDAPDHVNVTKQYYVGASRARLHLVVIAGEKTLEKFRARPEKHNGAVH